MSLLVIHWSKLISDTDAVFDKEIEIDVSLIKPQVTWGTSPEMVIDFDQDIPDLITVEEKIKEILNWQNNIWVLKKIRN